MKKKKSFETRTKEDIFWKTLFIEFFAGGFLAHFFMSHGLKFLILPMIIGFLVFLVFAPGFLYPKLKKTYEAVEGKRKDAEAAYTYNIYIYMALAFLAIFLSDACGFALYLSGVREPVLGYAKFTIFVVLLVFSFFYSIYKTKKKFDKEV